jgi:RNA polymerase sigma factor (sigma-70 family)
MRISLRRLRVGTAMPLASCIAGMWSRSRRSCVGDEAIERVESFVDDAVLTAALASLPPEQHAAIKARVIEGREYRDVASELGCSESVVRQRVSRGLSAMRSTVEEIP